jgi:hypothetical protein
MMSNCRLDGGYCFNPARPAGGGSMDPGEAAEAAGGAAPAAGGRAARGRRRGPNPLGRAAQPRPMSFGTQMNMLTQQCMSSEFDLGCLSGGGNGMCCIPFP